jgi:uncharacterized protein YeaO (DUF488 family)
LTHLVYQPIFKCSSASRKWHPHRHALKIRAAGGASCKSVATYRSLRQGKGCGGWSPDRAPPRATQTTDEETAMTLRVVRLGTARAEGEGLRIGTVRRPPRGVLKSAYGAQNWYDVWYPNLAPSLEAMKVARAAATPAEWQAFARRYRAEMATPENGRTLDLLAALSHQADFSVGCYCEDESRCHRSILRELLIARGARLA